MTKKANYNEVYSCVLNVTATYKLSTIPISLDVIIDNTKSLKKCKYSDLAMQYGCSVGEIIEFLGSELGAYVSNIKQTKFVIYYNDTLKNEGLDRFTIAHELGHHFLNHSKYLLENDRFVRGISNNKYNELEKESNCFARNLLTPTYLLHAIGIAPVNLQHVKNVFVISKRAAEIRRDLYGYDLHSMASCGHDLYVTQFYEHIKFYQHARSCLMCNSIFSVKGAKYCPICRSKKIELWGENKHMIYEDIKTNERLKCKICPVCENEETSVEGNYCQICGTYLINSCEKIDYDDYGNETRPSPCCPESEELPGNARFCARCGSETSFFKNGWLDKWNTTDGMTPLEYSSHFSLDDYE